MNAVLLGIVVFATVAIVWAGIYFTFRGFWALDHPRVKPKPRHDAATTARLKQFFEGKHCADCGRPIAPVRAFELRPGLMNAKTHEAIPWNDIPAENLSTTLETHVPICSNCAVLETVRTQRPDLVVDRHRTFDNPLP